MNEFKNLLRKSSELTRRDFAATAAQAFMGVGIGAAVANEAMAVDPRLQKAIEALQNGKKPAAEAADAGATESTASTESTESFSGGKAQSVIYFYMGGGMSHLDTFDTKPGAATQGPTKTISTKADGVTISEHFPMLAKQAKDVAFVNSLTSVQGAHEQGNYLMHTSYSPRGTIKHPCMGSWAVKMKGKMNPNLPGFVLIGGGGRAVTSGFFENKYGPAPVGNPRSGLQNSKIRISEKEFAERLQLADTYDRAFRGRYKQKQVDAYTDLYKEAIQLLNGEDIKAFNIMEESQQTFQKYGNSYIGQSCVLARRLVEAKTRFVEINYGGWDNHTGIFNGIGDRCRAMDQAIGALMDDLRSKGLLSSTLIVLSTEFGRTPRINGDAGRDHHPSAFSGFLAGAGIAGGQKYGKSDATGHKVEENPVQIPDFNATIATAMGLKHDKVIYSPSKRPFRIGGIDGKPVAALLA